MITLKQKILLLITPLISLLLTGCSTTTYTEYRGQSVVYGKGGTVKVVDGIDFWDNGEPDRKYEILGVIDDTRNEGLIPQARKNGTLAKIAKEHGGDAVILVSKSRVLRGVNADTGGAYYKDETKVMVVKYLPSKNL